MCAIVFIIDWFKNKIQKLRWFSDCDFHNYFSKTQGINPASFVFHFWDLHK